MAVPTVGHRCCCVNRGDPVSAPSRSPQNISQLPEWPNMCSPTYVKPGHKIGIYSVFPHKNCQKCPKYFVQWCGIISTGHLIKASLCYSIIIQMMMKEIKKKIQCFYLSSKITASFLFILCCKASCSHKHLTKHTAIIRAILDSLLTSVTQQISHDNCIMYE